MVVILAEWNINLNVVVDQVIQVAVVGVFHIRPEQRSASHATTINDSQRFSESS
jgi:hypothetical protein